MAKQSAGILLYRRRPEGVEVLLVHPGGPFWAKKDEAAWSIPKGLCEPNEDHLAAACREFTEETGFPLTGPFIPLGGFKQPGGKIVHAWAVEGDCDPSALKSNDFEMEWPPKSGKSARFPEADKAAWLAPREALRKLVKGQRPILESLFDRLGISHSGT